MVRLPDGVAERIDALVGPQKRSQFIREAVLSELERRAGAGTAITEPPRPVAAIAPDEKRAKAAVQRQKPADDPAKFRGVSASGEPLPDRPFQPRLKTEKPKR